MKKSRKILAMVLSVLTIAGTLFSFPMTASAADITVHISDTGWDEAKASNLWNGGTITGTHNFFILYISASKMLYCIEPGAPLSGGDDLDMNDYVNDLHTPSISDDAVVTKLLGRLFQYVDYGDTGDPLDTDKGKALYIATQILVWETTQGERDEDFKHVNPPSGYDKVKNAVDNSTMSASHKSMILGYYSDLVSKVQNHHTIPSFAKLSQANAVTYELTDNSGTLSVTLTDNNDVLSNYDFDVSGSNISFSKSGNKLTVTAKNGFDGDVTATLTSKNTKRKGVVCYGDGKGKTQDTVTLGSPIDDPVKAYFKLKAAVGNLSIVKSTKNNDGKVAGFQFEVKKGNTNIGTFTSGNDGKIDIPNLVAGTYTVREVNLSDEFVQPTPNPVTVEILSGKTATVNFDNVKKLGIITVRKSNANPIMGDYSLAGAEFAVKNANGAVVDTIVTAASGKGESKPLPLGAYTVYETHAPYGFVRDKNVYARTLSGSLGTAAIIYSPEIGVPERPQTGQVKITKLDTETAATAQGDATLSGAVFDLLDKDGKQVERLYCGNSVSITSKEVPLGNYTVKEVVPPLGYTLSQKEYPVKIEYSNDLIEIDLISANVSNMVIKGKIQIVKHSDDPDPAVGPDNPQVQEPLGGIVFEVHLKSAGSYESAKPSERDRITTDEHGYTVTKDLPYGAYIVTEVQGAPEHKICEPFEVFISTNGHTYYYIVENPTYFGKVKIVKVDAETDKTIPLAGTEFKVKNVDTGEWVAQEILYPTPIIIDSYLTNSDGWLVMPKELHFGNYELHEVRSPYGYLLSDKPIPFKVTSENQQEYLEVKMPNQPVKGKVTVQKTGEVLTGATENQSKDGKFYTPEYTVRGIAGATFDIIAAEDIVTPDGTIHAKKGAVVDTITTGVDGSATSKELYLGNYYATETAVPYGFLTDETPLLFSLVYQDQYTALVSAETGLYNERAKGEISLIKTAEEVKLDKSGGITYIQTPAKDIVFGLYARDDIRNVDDKIIIKADSLMDILITDGDGKAVSTRDIPFGAYYIRELTTKSNLVPSDKEYDAVFEYKDSKTPKISIAVNEDDPIENMLVKAKIKVIKTNEENQPLSGVAFTIKGVVTGITVELVTDENGIAETGSLPYDRYTIIETKTQESYVLDEHQHIILLGKDGETYEFGIVNPKIKGQIKVIKTDGKTKTPLMGVVFELKDSEGKVIATLTTDKDGIALTGELMYGKYTLTEKSTGKEYVLDSTPHEIFIKDHKQIVELRLQNFKKPDTPQTPKTPKTPPASTTPKTGDDSSPLLWIVLAGIAASALTVLAIMNRRRKMALDKEA